MNPDILARVHRALYGTDPTEADIERLRPLVEDLRQALGVTDGAATRPQGYRPSPYDGPPANRARPSAEACIYRNGPHCTREPNTLRACLGLCERASLVGY